MYLNMLENNTQHGKEDWYEARQILEITDFGGARRREREREETTMISLAIY